MRSTSNTAPWSIRRCSRSPNPRGCAIRFLAVTPRTCFLKDKKGRYFLVTLEENAEVNLKTIHTLIGASGRVSFGKPEALMEKLGVAPGSVTIFSAINDPDHEVTIVIDAPLMEYDIINAHPLINEATTSIGREDLKRFLADTGHEPMILKVST
jgi:Ala-tRNA(Pro) deacylase